MQVLAVSYPAKFKRKGFTLTEVLIAIALLAVGTSTSLYLIPHLHQVNKNVVYQYELDAWAQNELSQLNQRALFRERYLTLSTTQSRHQTEQHSVRLSPQTARFASWAINRENHTFSGAFANYGWVPDPDQILVRECRSEPPAMVY